MGGRGRLIVAALIALVAVIGYFGKTSLNLCRNESRRGRELLRKGRAS